MIIIEEIKTEEPLKVDVVTNAIIKKGFSPYIGENGNWYEYNNETKTFIDTGVKAEGKDGINGINGQNGLNGQNGKDGYTPIKGIDYFDGIDGKNGKDGKDGENGYTPQKGIDYFDGINGRDGYTPIRGTDYWTEADRTEIETYCKNYIDTNITNAIGGEY